jgi:stage II sporulation protein D
VAEKEQDMSWANRAGRRRVVSAVALSTLIVSLAHAGPASADEIYPRPADQSVTLAGHGYGHGHGMSQWGAYGAARSGLLWSDIMRFYYPGTVQTTIAQPTIRVKVTGLLGSTARVANDGNLQASFGTGHTGAWTLPTAESSGAKIVDYRIELGAQSPGVPTKAVLRYATNAGVVKTYVTAPGNQINIRSLTGAAVRGIAPNGTYISYPGEFRGILVGAAGTEAVTPVVANGLDTYLRGVVPSEMPASWSAEALKSQAVAARSYAYYELNHPQNAASYDTCDTTSCQVYKGSTWQSGSTVTSIEQPSSNAAITATGNIVLTYNGASAFTQFSAANGGYMTAGSQPYLVGATDPYDGVVPNSAHSWTAEVSVAAIQSRWPSIGLYRDMRIVSRDGHGEWGGRVQSMVLEGNSGSVTMSGATFRTAFGLKSEWFIPTDPPFTPAYPRDFNGDAKADVTAVVGSTGELRAYYGNGAGGWAGFSVIGTGFSQYAHVFTAGTWDADPFADVLAMTPAGDLYLYSGTGGVLAAPRLVGRGWNIYNAVFPVGDFSGDGLSDLLARKPDGSLWLYKGNGQGGFLGGGVRIGAGWNIFTSIFGSGDFDGDGKMDVVARASDGRLLLYAGNGTGGWKSSRVIGAGWNTFSSIISSGDFTGDRASDIIARSTDGNLWLYPGNGQGGFLTPRGVGAGWNLFSTVLP